MHALIFSMEDGRVGPPRMPEALRHAGIGASALCPRGNLLADSLFVLNEFHLPRSRSVRALGKALCAAIEASGADIVIPGDEQAVMLMHAVRHRNGGRDLGPAVRRALDLSLGAADRFDAAIFKSHTLRLARSLGICTPAGETAVDGDHAIGIAGRLGYPVYLKESFSWAGLGVQLCRSDAELLAAFPAPGRLDALRTTFRKVTGRDWFPLHTPCDVQGAVSGSSALFCGFAWRGKLLGGFAGYRIEQLYPNGPSRSLRLSHDPLMAQAACRMVEGLAYTGFFSFDFMLPEDGSAPVLLECNPRLVPVTHCGAKLGVDLMAMLAACLRGDPVPTEPLYARHSIDILLFPYSLTPRDDEYRLHLDYPEQDHGLIKALVRRKVPEPAPATTATATAAAAATASPGALVHSAA